MRNEFNLWHRLIPIVKETDKTDYEQLYKKHYQSYIAALKCYRIIKK